MPKERHLSVDVAGSKQQAAERLKAETKPSLFPSFASILAGGEQPLRGRVTEDGFVVSENRAGHKRVVATARGRFEDTPTGTRATVDIGIPPAMVWMLRVSYLLSLGAVGFAGYELLTAGEGVAVAGILAVFMVLATAATGWNVHQAEQQIPELQRAVSKALTGPVSEPVSQSEAQREQERRRRQRASEAAR